jgi:EAL domain-containing protein (putative c-di-GMP-specific phosphodiesterase class I)
LRALGCDTCQGFVESEALPAAGIEARYGARG